MSYMRCDWPLVYFKGYPSEYVFLSGGTKEHPETFVEDCGSEYKDNASLCELIGTIIYHHTHDIDYAYKMIKVLARKLRVEHKLRKKPATANQVMKIMSAKIKRDKVFQSLLKEIGSKHENGK